jgi:hypothetical protein
VVTGQNRLLKVLVRLKIIDKNTNPTGFIPVDAPSIDIQNQTVTIVLTRLTAVLGRCSPNGESDNSASTQWWSATSKYMVNGAFARERLKGIEPSSSVWKTEALPLSYSRV